ncbi:MAG: DegT/DnrJ/EryC1/StrS family aminotransferase [bacterium]|nr:DegT/DnrJ/EryC1/StrS family aminotransferase [bacterium]MDZ4285963.1 DegT/DnrJ/EryC1/StrS family aminotransferase [Candidatus Sungbacteria bacterium]
MVTDIYPYNKLSVRPRIRGQQEAAVDALLTDHFGVEAVTVSSARAGIYLILKQLGLTRQDHIVASDFLCRSVLYILNLLGFAVQVPDERTKAIFVVHQWGYPQRMDIIMDEAKKHRWFVIEDCVHTFGSSYRGQVVGSFGDAAVVSFPKLFPTYVGGAVLSKRGDIINHVRDERSKPRSIAHRVFDYISVRVARQNYLGRNRPFLATAAYIKSIHFPRIPRAALRRLPRTSEDIASDLARRKRCFETLKKSAGPVYHPKALDEDSDVIPLCVPIFLPEEKLATAKLMLKEKNIKADILHFDVNRNVLNPLYKKCLALPCHQYVTDEELNAMCDVITRV